MSKLKDRLNKRLKALRQQPKPKPPRTAPARQDSALPPEILEAAKQNWKLFPLRPRDKKPQIRNWPAAVTDDIAQLERWQREFPACNWGMATGEASGVDVLDIDGQEGMLSFRSWEALGQTILATRTHTTSRGQHILLRHIPGVRNSASKIAPGIDVRGDGGYIVYPSSTHPDGSRYEIGNHAPPAETPEWLRKKLLSPKPSTKSDVIPEGQRHTTLVSAAGTLRRHGKTPEEIEAALLELNQKCEPPLSDEDVRRIAASSEDWRVPDAVQTALNDPRSKLFLPGDDRLLSDFAADLGEQFKNMLLFIHNGEVVRFCDGVLHVVTPQSLRSLIEHYVVCCKKRSINRTVVDVGVSMQEADARGVLASEQFKQKLRPLSRINLCRMPVLRPDGRIELLPEGYDRATQTMTISDVEYSDDMAFDEGLAVIKDLFGEFNFTDARSRAVAVAGLLGLYAAQIVRAGSLRPSFITTKNAEGAGGTLITACMTVPVVGKFPTSDIPSGDEEMRKTLLSHVRKADSVIIFDNVKTKIGSGPLEAFITAPRWSGRLLGLNETFEGTNCATVFVTANGATVSPDMRRRSLFIELHLDEERAEDHKFARTLDVDVLQTMRPQILAGCFSLVRRWDELGRPEPKRSHSAFPKWARIIGGIVESAGFGCALDTAEITGVADEDGDAMRALVKVMRKGKTYKFTEIVDLCRSEEVFVNLVEGIMDNAHRRALSYVLSRYDKRAVGEHRFLIEGRGHQRRYRVEKMESGEHDSTIKHDLPTATVKTPLFCSKVKHRASSCHRASAKKYTKEAIQR